MTCTTSCRVLSESCLYCAYGNYVTYTHNCAETVEVSLTSNRVCRVVARS